MDEKTLTALNGSIEKWEAIVAGIGEDLCASNCPLCQAHEDCTECPVMEATGHGQCMESPWEEWDNYVARQGKRVANTPERIKLAQSELDFLRSLLPADATAPKTAER